MQMIKTCNPELFLVTSESDCQRLYTVDTRLNSYSCPHHRFRGAYCKHLKAVANHSIHVPTYEEDMLSIYW